MAGRIKQLSRQLSTRAIAPMLVLAIGVPTRPDPTKRIGGTAGIIVIPSVSAPAPTTSTHGEPAPVEARRDGRADRGRVLYAAGRAPRDTAAARPVHKPCADPRLVQTRGGGPAPTI